MVKYLPQAYVNYKRKSTVGWSIDQIVFDLVGGAFSLGQVFLDASIENSWAAISGNPAKLLLANITVCFDLIFVFQHYALYRESGEMQRKPVNSQTPLLAEDPENLR